MEQRESDLIYKRGYEGPTHEAEDICYVTVYSEPTDYGEAFNYPFENVSNWANLLGEYGYQITSNITRGNPREKYDHQVWNVTQIDTQQEHVLKVVSARYYHDALGEESTTSEMMSRTKKEAEVLKQLNHQNVVRLLEVIGLRDPKTSFPYVFIATIMEKMEGSVDTLKREYPDPERTFRLPVLLGRQILFQAICARNILYRWIEEIPHFQLADFEECILYERTEVEEKIQNGEVFDRIPCLGYGRQTRAYGTHCSSPEYRSVRRSGSMWALSQIRTLPNDIYCVAATVIYLTEGVAKDERGRTVRNHYLDDKIWSLHNEGPWDAPFDELLRRMTCTDPQLRITAQELTNSNNKLFSRLDY